MTKYKYPDKNDKITYRLIDSVEPYANYWYLSEQRILNAIKKTVGDKNLRMLDAGCGEGRLVKEFLGCFDEITAIDPDDERITKAMDLLKSELSANVEFINTSIENFADAVEYRQKFDVIICSHIIQHLDIEKTNEILSALRQLLKPSGTLHLTTTHSQIGKEYYTKSYLVNNEMAETEMTVKDFNDFNKEDELKIRYFTYDSLYALIEKVDMKIVNWRVFHNNDNSKILDSIFGIDNVINWSQQKKHVSGRDIYISCQFK